MQVITPYVFEEEIKSHQVNFMDYDVYYEKDIAGIGSDLMFQKMWNKFPDKDIFILHADMGVHDEDWDIKIKEYAESYPKAGMIGCLLLYPAKDEKGNYYIQHAGGKFTNDVPDHYGSGLNLEMGKRFKDDLEIDTGQYDKVRKVAWTTFGGLYIRREVINKVGNFSPEFEWTYNRDVDYCLQARKLGYDILNVPVRLLHHESRDNKRIKDDSKLKMEMRNLKTLQEKWKGTEWYTTL